MALILNGTSQAASKAIASLTPSTDNWAIFCWARRLEAETDGMILGGSRSTSFARLSGIYCRDVSGAVVSSVLNNGSTTYQGTISYPHSTWLPMLRTKTGSDANVSYTTNVNGTVHTADQPNNGEINTWVAGASYSSGSLTNFFGGAIAHVAIWRGSLPGSTTIAQLMAGTLPNECDDPPDEYTSFVNDSTGWTLHGSPTIDSDDPITPPAPEISSVNEDDTVSDASAGNTVTVSLGLDSVSDIVIRDADDNETVCTTIAGSGTDWTFSAPALADRDAAYYGPCTLVLTGVYDSDPVELEIPVTFNPPSGLTLTTLAADPDTSDQAVGYGIVTIAEGAQYAVDATKLVIFDDALAYSIGSQSVQVAHVYDGTMTVFTLLTGEESAAGSGFTARGFTAKGFTARGFTARGL